jgi:hypothetical protein
MTPLAYYEKCHYQDFNFDDGIFIFKWLWTTGL